MIYKVKRFAAITTLDRVRQEGLLDGRVKFTHATKTENVPSIHKQGLLGSKAHDKDTWTKAVKSAETDKDIVYLSKHKETTDSIKHHMEKAGRGPISVLNISVPYKNYKKDLKQVENPAAYGTNNFEDWVEELKKRKGIKVETEDDLRRSRKGYRHLIENVETIEDRLDSKYIKGSDSYKRHSVKELGSYIKNNPKRFMKGIGQIAKGVVKYPFEKIKKD